MKGNFLIVSNEDCLKTHQIIAEQYQVGYEINDFMNPAVLDDEKETERIIESYRHYGVPAHSTMHGVFYDIVPFSQDSKIRQISLERMRQSLLIASRLGVKGVVFHTNVNPDLTGDIYDEHWVDCMAKVLTQFLEEFPALDIYLENMFDRSPELLGRIAKRLNGFSHFGICLDWAHANLYGSGEFQHNPQRWAEELRGYIKHIHINDNDLKSDLHWAVGSGWMDWQCFADTYVQYFSDCTVLIETTNPKAQITSLEFLEKLLGKGVIPMGERDGMTNEQEHAEEMLAMIFHCMNRLATEHDFDTTITIMTELGQTLVHSDRASFWYWDVKNRQYWTMAALGSERIVIPQGSGIVGASITNRETILINNPYEDERFNPDVDKKTGYCTKSILCMPVYNSAGDVIGALQAINKIGRAGFDEQDEKRMLFAATFGGKIVETHMLRIQNQIDALTGLKNRKGFYEYYEQVIEPFCKENEASIIMCDIDHFKRVNDEYGHNAGDAVLCKVATILSQGAGTAGEVFRWGGEEFILLLRTNHKDAIQIAQQIRKNIEESTCVFEQSRIRHTMSFGVAAICREKSADLNIKTADELLYQAKNTGRNRVVFACGDEV